MRKLLLLLFLNAILGVCYAGDIIINTENFSASKLQSIPANSTVLFEPGVYSMTAEICSAWAKKRNNVIYNRKGDEGEVIIDASALDAVLSLKFEYSNSIIIKNMRFKNMKLAYNRCNDGVFENLTIEDNTSGCDMIGLYRCNNTTVKNCKLFFNDELLYGRGICIWNGDHNKIIDNIIRGHNLRGAIKAWSSQNGDDRSLNLLIKGGEFSRGTSDPNIPEDHGIYVHDASKVVIDGVSIKGFSHSSSGGSIKLKNDDDIEVKNCVFRTSGMLLRIEEKVKGFRLENLWIHDNLFIDGTIGSWTPNLAPKAIVIENNRFLNGSVIFGQYARASNLNLYSNLARKSGGIYRNEIVGNNRAPKGTNMSGNFIRTLEIEGVEPSNTALNKTCRQSNDFAEATTADKAVDGDTTSDQVSLLAHTLPGPNRYWQINLGGVAEIHEIKIWGRTDEGSTPLKNFHIIISNDFMKPNTGNYDATKEAHSFKYTQEGEVDKEFSKIFESPVFGKYVRIQLASQTDALALAEVQIIGKMLTTEDPSTDPKPVPEAVPTVMRLDPAQTTISLYPSPAESTLNIKSNRKIIDYTIYSVNGEILASGYVNNNILLKQISFLKKGVYAIRLNMEGGASINKKFLKQ